MESKKINQLATELSPALDDLTIIGDPITGISKKITLSQMASLFTGTVEEYANLAAFPLVGVADTIYIALDTNVLYRWNGTAYVELSPNIINSLVFNDANGFDGTIVLSGSVATLTITTALTLGSVPFIGASGALIQDNANLFYDDTNNRLGIGTNAPTTPLDVFGSGIISRINGTSTNNGFLGFSSAGSNKWSVGNVQSDHRFRIFSEANSAELVSLLQTGEFGIGIANPTTKLHIDGGATALIANLDANVSVAKSLSFRSDNSNRINLEVSGSESGSDAGGDFFLRTFTDAGALKETPLSIVRSTGVTTIKSLTLTGALSGTSATFTGSVGSNAIDGAFVISGGVTNRRYIDISNVGGSGKFGIESNAGGGIITGSTGYDMAMTGSSGISFSGNGGTNLHARLSNTGVLTGTFSGPLTGNASTATNVAVGGITGLGTGIGTSLSVNAGSNGALVITGTATGSSTTVIIGGATATNPLSTRAALGESHWRVLNADGTTYGDFERSVTGSGALRFTGAFFRITGTLETEAINAGGAFAGTSATFSSTITTGAPSGGTAKPFKIGNVATVTPTLQNRTIEIEIDGTTYYLTAKTTNN